MLCETIGSLKYRLRRKKAERKELSGLRRERETGSKGFPCLWLPPAPQAWDARQILAVWSNTDSTTQELEKQPGEGVMMRLSGPKLGEQVDSACGLITWKRLQHRTVSQDALAPGGLRLRGDGPSALLYLISLCALLCCGDPV